MTANTATVTPTTASQTPQAEYCAYCGDHRIAIRDTDGVWCGPICQSWDRQSEHRLLSRFGRAA